MIVADPLAGQNLTQAARTALQRLDGILADNSAAIKNTMANLSTFSDALARNSQKVDSIVAGIEKMTGGGAATTAGAIYDLTAPTSFPPLGKKLGAQLSIGDPSAVLLLDTQKIVVRPQAPDNPSFENARWSDSLPKLIQARIVQSFENSKYFSAVARQAEALSSDYQLLIDVRSFQISTAPEAEALVELSARLVGENGKIKESRVFRSTVPAKIGDAAGATSALNEAFSKVAKEIVIWTAGAV
jgi:phospholipid/cholesterol/gamma-HCH transport system substrate-binding protein